MHTCIFVHTCILVCCFSNPVTFYHSPATLPQRCCSIFDCLSHGVLLLEVEKCFDATHLPPAASVCEKAVL